VQSEIDDKAADKSAAVTPGPGKAAADKIRNLFPERQPSGALGEFVTVLDGLDRGETDFDTARQWASIDLFGVFLGDGTEALPADPGGGFWRFLEAAVQVGVFIPIAVTWIGLATAAWVYRSAENGGTLGGESFLQGWERGFGELPAGLTFDWFATYTCMLVTLLVAATAALLRHRLRADQAEAEQRRQLTEALVAAHLVLAPYRLPAEERAARELDVAADKVTALVSAFDAATGNMSASAGAAGAAADKMTATATAFGIATKAMTATADKVKATAGAVDTAAGKMTATAGAFDTASGAMTATASAVNTAAGKMASTAGTFDTAAGLMTTAAGKVAATADVINATADPISATAGAVKSAADAAAATQQKAANAVAAASAAIAGAESAAAAATAAAGVLEGSSNRLGGEVAGLTTATGQARDSLAEVADAVSSHASRVEAAADVLGQARRAIDLLPAAVTALQSEVAAAVTQLGALHQVTTAMTDLKDSLDTTGSASDRIATAFTGGNDVVRDFLAKTSASAADTANRVELAADILGRAQQTIDALAPRVTDLSGQLTNLTDVTNAVGELRASLDQVRTALETGRPARRSSRVGAVFKVFRKRGTPAGR
jgi:hypothetical protein